MNHRSVRLLVSFLVLLFVSTACQGPAPVASTPSPLPTLPPLVVTQTPAIQPTTTPAPSAVPKGALTCPPPGPLPANAQLAARVNGQGISLDLYNRQFAQAQEAFKQQGIDLNSSAGQETLKSLRQQVLDQMINEVVIAQQAEKESIRVADADLNARLAQMVQDAGSVEKVNAYLDKFQVSLGDFCAQMRSSMLGEKMLDRATSALPTQAEQVHVRQILVSTSALAQTLRDRARKGEDFASLARQYSMDETSKPNGGDVGWVPKGILPPELDAVIFQLSSNQVSDVVTTQLGYHVVQVLARDKARALPPEYVQKQRESYFLTSLQGWRDGMKIERLVR